MNLTTEEAYACICWSADVPDVSTLLDHLSRMPKLTKIKIDRLFVATNGYEVFNVLRELGKEVFYDAKIVEIPSKLAANARIECKKSNPWMLNCMAGAASGGLLSGEDPETIEGLKRFADVCHDHGVRSCAVTVLTSKKPEFVVKEFNGRNSAEQVLFYVEMLRECGFTDVVCAPDEVPVIRAESRFDILDLNTPGIRRAKSSLNDQARTNTPAGALQAGATRLIIGRDLTTGNPSKNLDDIIAEIIVP